MRKTSPTRKPWLALCAGAMACAFAAAPLAVGHPSEGPLLKISRAMASEGGDHDGGDHDSGDHSGSSDHGEHSASESSGGHDSYDDRGSYGGGSYDSRDDRYPDDDRSS